jgi:hypothetical protein
MLELTVVPPCRTMQPMAILVVGLLQNGLS